ncbi:hypothetical protein [Sphingosinithalassobacter sp. LHW66-3]|uniref:hypothetical protein n=1 Tax=Sphingosinithalassobacter sp. LHW66-3 TaxID=3424718 RepID=UPI003D6C0811
MLGVFLGAAPTASAAAQSAGPPAAPTPAATSTSAGSPRIEESGYVRLEVVLTLNATQKTLTFNTACPKTSLWSIDLKELMEGAEHVTLGVSVSAPNLAPVVFTPLSLDRKRGGFLGLGRSCDVHIDEMRYLSPAYYVARYRDEQFGVSPTYVRTLAPNPGLKATIDAAASAALKLAGVPVETAAPYQNAVTSLLAGISAGAKEVMTRHPIIRPGAVPPDTDFQWRTQGLFRDPQNGRPVDVVLTARLIPVATLMSGPTRDSAGRATWSVSGVLASPYAANIAPGLNPGGTINTYLEGAAGNVLASYRNAQTFAEAQIACGSLLDRVRGMGLSVGDQALLMWAVTHDRPPAALTRYDVDRLDCLAEAWEFVPGEVGNTRVTEATVAPVLSPPTIRQMQGTTQIDDAFAVFLKTAVWDERQRHGTVLFAYPASYEDPAAALFDRSATLANADQWLALRMPALPVVDRVGCYTYVPAADGTGTSVMYAVADTLGGDRPPQVLLVASFANAGEDADARIRTLSVSPTVSEEQRRLIRTANGSQCRSGYAPGLIFDR